MSGLPAAAAGHGTPPIQRPPQIPRTPRTLRARRTLRTRRAGGHRVPRAVAGTGLLVAGVLVLPLVFLISEAAQVGRAQVIRLMLRQLTATLLLNTIELTVMVTAACAVIGVACAWVVERTNLPGRRVWATLVVLPVAMPDFVVGYAWTSAAPAIRGLAGAVLVMTLSVYPLVYLPVAASLRTADSTLEEVARCLGHGRVKVFLRVTLPQIRTALFGGCLVVALALLAEYGAFEIVGFQTFTTEIVTEFRVAFDSAAACALSLVLVALGITVLAGDALMTAAKRTGRRGAHGTRPPRRYRLGVATLPVVGGFAVLAGAAVAVPVTIIVYWMIQGQRSSLPSASIAAAAAGTVAYSLPAAAVATVAALPVALLAVRYRSRGAVLLERATYLVQGLPGPVIALSFVFFAVHYAIGIYQSPELLVAGYAVLFFPLALIAVRAALTHAPPQLEEVARSLGRRPAAAALRVTVPLIAPGLAAAFSLVFLSAVTELTTTLILIPTGAHTLATAFWAQQSNTSYAAAAPYAGLLVLIAVVPGYALGRYLDRAPVTGAGRAASPGGPPPVPPALGWSPPGQQRTGQAGPPTATPVRIGAQ